jgi:GT2 family glycosyltransferase
MIHTAGKSKNEFKKQTVFFEFKYWWYITIEHTYNSLKQLIHFFIFSALSNLSLMVTLSFLLWRMCLNI